MKIVVGLGNPGDEYAATRHNAGFLVVDYLAEHFNCENWKLMKKTNCYVTQCNIDGKKMLFAKPNVYMNESGIPVSALLKWHDTELSDFVVIHDDTDLEVGAMKMQFDRGAAGHNGVASIIQHVGGQNFERIRLGVRPKENSDTSIDLVLKNFSAADYQSLISTFSAVEQYIEGLLDT